MRIKAPLVLLLGIGLGSAWLPDELAAQSQSAETLLQEGILRFKVGQFKQAAKLLKRARKRAKDPRVKAKVHLHLGLSYGVLGQQSKARASFDRALRADPTVELDPAETKKDLLLLFSRVRQGITGKLEITADREGAVVKIDGEKVGTVPHTNEVPVGRHRVEVSTPDSLHGYQGDMVVPAGGLETLHAKLTPLKGMLDVSSSPAGATVKVDDRDLGSTPLRGIVLDPGEHQVELVLDGHQSQMKKILVSAGVTASVQASLEPLKPAEPEVTTKQAFVPETRSHRRLWTWIAAGGALAAASTGLAFGIWARTSWNNYKDAATKGDDGRYNDLKDALPTRALVANVSFAAAGALAVTAAVLYLFVETPKKTPAVGAALGPSSFLFTYEF